LTAVRTVTLPTPDGQPRLFIVKDESGDADAYPLIINPFGATTIDDLSFVEITVPYGSVYIYSDGVNYYTKTERTAGQVKCNTGNSLKPTITNPSVYTQLVYASPLGFSSYPTNKWPQNIDVPADSDFYDFVNDTFIENTILGQINKLRIIVDYSGKPSSQDAGLRIRLRNTLSGFVLEDIAALDKESTSGSVVFSLTTIADQASLPSPKGTGHGYEIHFICDENITLVVDSVVRISEKVD